MTNEEIYASIFSHETIYIPPHEEKSAPLEVALGCSWHKCRFCDFAKDEFHIHPLEKIEQNIFILSQFHPDNKRLFLLGENAFVMSCERLCEILQLRDQYMPWAKEVAMYSRIDDILKKTDEELRILYDRGLRALHIGIESGCDSILEHMNKGVTSFEIIEALRRLDQVGIAYYLTVIMGLGGRTFSNLHAVETARLLNRTHPKNIWCLKLKLWEDTPLYKEYKQGIFDMMTPREILAEERIFLQNLTVENCLFEDTTVLDLYTLVGMLPEKKQELLEAMTFLLR